MKNKTKRTERMIPKGVELPCGELGPDDGVDPRILFRREERKKSHLRKDRQLCKQAFTAIALALDQLAARWAQDVYLAGVKPAPDASRLAVTIGFARPFTFDEAQHVLQRLASLSGSFRWELGSVISRKKVPELVFALDTEVHDGS